MYEVPPPREKIDRDLCEAVEALSFDGFVSIWNLWDLEEGEEGGPRVHAGRNKENTGVLRALGSELSNSCKKPAGVRTKYRSL